MSRISEVINYDDLDNGLLTPDKDVVIADTIALSNPTIKYLAVDQDPIKTAKSGKGCYRSIYFPTPFSGPLTIAYSTYKSTRSEIHDDSLSVGDANLSYTKVGNKTSVVDDGDRNSINFNQISDIEPLLARYLLLQQFDGKPLLSYATIARAMDNYFENYWEKLPINLVTGEVEPNIPWLRTGTANNRIDASGDSLSMTLDGVTDTLNPVDPILNSAFDTMMAKVATLTPTESIDKLVNAINDKYSAGSRDVGVTVGKDFDVVDNTLVLTINNTVYPINWAEAAVEAASLAEKAISETKGITGYVRVDIAQKALQTLYEDTLTNDDSAMSYSIDSINGHSLRYGNIVLQSLGEKHLAELKLVEDNLDNYRVDDIYLASISLASELSELSELFNPHIVFNGGADTPDDILDFLES